MKAGEVLADFQFLGNRVAKFTLETRLVEGEGEGKVDFDFDYEIRSMEEGEETFFAVLALIVTARAGKGRKNVFKLSLDMEGLFAGNRERLSREQFMQMVELNGLITLLHLCRAYLMTVTAQSGINPPGRLPMINILKLKEEKAQSN